MRRVFFSSFVAVLASLHYTGTAQCLSNITAGGDQETSTHPSIFQLKENGTVLAFTNLTFLLGEEAPGEANTLIPSVVGVTTTSGAAVYDINSVRYGERSSSKTGLERGITPLIIAILIFGALSAATAVVLWLRRKERSSALGSNIRRRTDGTTTGVRV